MQPQQREGGATGRRGREGSRQRQEQNRRAGNGGEEGSSEGTAGNGRKGKQVETTQGKGRGQGQENRRAGKQGDRDRDRGRQARAEASDCEERVTRKIGGVMVYEVIGVMIDGWGYGSGCEIIGVVVCLCVGVRDSRNRVRKSGGKSGRTAVPVAAFRARPCRVPSPLLDLAPLRVRVEQGGEWDWRGWMASRHTHSRVPGGWTASRAVSPSPA